MHFTDVEYWVSLLSPAINGFGARPFRPIELSTLVIFLFAGAFWFADPFAPDGEAKGREPRLLFCLLYSLDTFLPVVNISGVREWGWVPLESWRWVLVAERVAGVFLSAIAAYSVGATF